MTAQESLQQLIKDVQLTSCTMPRAEAKLREFVDRIVASTNAREWFERATVAEAEIIKLRNELSWRENPDRSGGNYEGDRHEMGG